jgi:hypothetical protein
MFFRSLIFGLLMLFALSGCAGADSHDGPTRTVQDSAGITIVTNHYSAWSSGEVWQVSRRPVLRIGELDGPLAFTFGNIRAVGWLPDGRIYVGDEQAHSISIFSADGDFLETVGRQGQGPGELQWFLTVSPYRGDSLWVYDYGQHAVTVFSPELAFARRFRNPIVEGNYWVVSALADGRFLLYSPGRNRLPGGPGIVPDTSFVIVSAPDGTSSDTVGAFEVTKKRLGPDGWSEGLFLQPYGTLVGYGDRIVWTEGVAFEYVESTPVGSVRRIVRIAESPSPVTDEIIQEFKAHYVELASASPEGDLDQITRALEDGEYASELPETSPDLRIDALNNVWVGRYHFPGLITSEWEVFDPQGVWLGTVQTPPGLSVHEIGVDRIIGVSKDDFDVPYVQVHRLDRKRADVIRGQL